MLVVFFRALILYAVVCSQGEFSSKVGYLAYNKKIFEAAGAEDPRELYEKGKWDWNAFEAGGWHHRSVTPRKWRNAKENGK